MNKLNLILLLLIASFSSFNAFAQTNDSIEATHRTLFPPKVSSSVRQQKGTQILGVYKVERLDSNKVRIQCGIQMPASNYASRVHHAEIENETVNLTLFFPPGKKKKRKKKKRGEDILIHVFLYVTLHDTKTIPNTILIDGKPLETPVLEIPNDTH